METAALDLEITRTAQEVDREFARMDEPGRAAIAISSPLDRGKTLSRFSRQEARLRRAVRNLAADLTAMKSEENFFCTNEPGKQAA